MSVNEKMTAIADAIREKTGETGPLTLDAMAQKIRQLEAWLINTAKGHPLTLTDSLEMRLRGLKLFGKTTQNGTPTPEAPVPLVSAGDGGSLDVTVAGKNLYNAALYPLVQGIWINADGGVSENGSFAATKLYVPVKYLAGETITLNKRPGGGNPSIAFYDESYTVIYILKNNNATKGTPMTVTVPLEAVFMRFSTVPDDNEIQIEIGDTATDYELYRGQTITVSTPNGLPGIPVSSGGNYTDEAGQQWVCDEVDFSRGVYVQRIGTIDSYNGETVGNVFISSTGALTNDANVLYRLAQPVETVLSAEELSAYAALHTNYPNTTILNDGGAWMDVQYVADTKLYIDNKINAMAVAIVNA